VRNLVFRFTIALLSFGIGIVAATLATPSRLLSLNQNVAGHLPDVHQERTDFKFISILGRAGTEAALVAQTVERLREIKTGQFDTKIPPAAKPLLTRLKHQLRDVVIETINQKSEREGTPQLLQEVILVQLKAAGVNVQKREEVVYSENYFQKPYAYGDIFGITIEQPAGHPELLVATTTLGICCGEDTSFYVFKKDNGYWKLILLQESNAYDEVSGAQGMFQYAISPLDDKSDFFVVTANVNPWCTSNWQSIRYKVLRVGPSAYQPRIILSDEDTIYLGEDPPYQLHVEGNAFSLSFASDEFMDRMNNGEELSEDEIASSHVVKYRIDGNSAVRVPKTEASEKGSGNQP
jgi:hypothetical protein